jgi:hypothetical protein
MRNTQYARHPINNNTASRPDCLLWLAYNPRPTRSFFKSRVSGACEPSVHYAVGTSEWCPPNRSGDHFEHTHAIEAQIRGQPPDLRRQIRQQQSRPLLDSLEVWLRERLLTLSTQSDTTKAINYMLNQWQALIYYCEDGIAEIDNNIAENALLGCCLGRKNFLFLGADSGGDRAAAMYSLIVSARMNGLDPQAYDCFRLIVLKNSVFSVLCLEY